MSTNTRSTRANKMKPTEDVDTKDAPIPKRRRGNTTIDGNEQEKNAEQQAAKGAPKRGRRAAVIKAEEESDEEPEKQDMKKNENGIYKKDEKTKRRTKAAKKNTRDDEDEDAEAVVVKSGRPRRNAAKKADEMRNLVEEEEEEDEKPKPVSGKGKGRKKAADEDKKGVSSGKGKKSIKKEEDDEESADAKSGRKGVSSGKGKKSIKKEEDDDESADTKSGASMTKSIRRTVQIKGRAAVDPLCGQKVNTAHVYADDDLIYDVMLNQTNIGNNNNKFYIIQLLEDDNAPYFSVWFRWGRVGYDGQNKLVGCGTNLQKAKHEFASKFEAKTKNDWPTTFADFDSYPGKYTMIEMDYGGDEKDSDAAALGKEQEEEEKKCQVVSKLDNRVQNVIQMICSISRMAATVREMEYDANKSPLGKLTQQQIKEGYACLKKVEEFINTKSFGAEWKHAVNEYYTKIPHACGFRPPELIKTPQLLKKEIELLDVLADIEIAIKTMKQETKEEDVHPIDRHYGSLRCSLDPLQANDEEYKLVTEYLVNTHASTHWIKMKPKNVFKVSREGEDVHEKKMAEIGNRRLLWHGSRLSNFFGILSQGLRIAPPEAPATGYMFGKGVYFADMASKSGNYCYSSNNGETGFLLLAEVALGNLNAKSTADYNANRLPPGMHSTWGQGATEPDPTVMKKILDDVAVPCGAPLTRRDRQGLLYNEFIVYDIEQIRMRFLVEVEFSGM